MADISIVVPAYNEEKTIKKTIEDVKESIKNLKDKIDVTVIDDGSNDKTAKILSSIKGIKVIRNTANRGYGASLKTAIKNITSDYLLIIDGDGTYPASSIPTIIGYSKEYDMVVGARTGKIVKIPIFRRPAKWFLRHFAQYLTKTKIPDLNSGLRIFKRDIA